MRTVFASLVLFAAVEAAGLEVIAGPYALNVKTDSVDILWESATQTSGAVDYGIADYSSNATGAQVATTTDAGGNVCLAHLSGLQGWTSYQYRLTVSGEIYEGHFKTAPSPSDAFGFAVVGDNRWDNDYGTNLYWSEIAPNVLLDLPEQGCLLLHSGDFIQYPPDYAQYEPTWTMQFFQPARDLIKEIVLAGAYGNHERSYSSTDFDDYFMHNTNNPGKFYYSFDYGMVHFTVLDTQDDPDYFAPGTPQRDWLENDLSSTSLPWKVVIEHKQPYSCNRWNSADITAIRQNLHPVMKNYGVALVVCGHCHMFEHTNVEGVHYVTSGGCGAGLYGDSGFNDSHLIYARVHHYCIVSVSASQITLSARYGHSSCMTADCDGHTPRQEFYSFAIPAGGGYSISGAVTEDANPVDGVRVEADSSHWAYTNASGAYTITGLVDGTYTVTPSKLAYTFTPPSTQVTVSGEDETGVDFAATFLGGGTVTFQEGLDGYAGCEDAYIRQEKPGTNYGDEDEIRAYESTYDYASVIRFDLSTIPTGSQVDSATLGIYLQNRYGSGNLYLGRLTASWAEMQATWNDRLTGTSWSSPGARSDAVQVASVPQPSTGWVSVDVKQTVSDWIAGAQQNHGFLLWADGDIQDRFWSSDYSADTSLRPKLTVTYAAGGPRPPTVSISAGATQILQGESVVFTADAQDPDGTIVLYEWDFDGGVGYETGTATVSHPFDVAGTFSVRARVTDDEDMTAVSDPVTIVVEADSDGDGMPDDWEIANLLDPGTDDASDDADDDDLINIDEYHAGTDPQKADTDGDGIPDGDDRDPLGRPLPLAGGCGGAGAGVALALLALLRRREP